MKKGKERWRKERREMKRDRLGRYIGKEEESA